MTAPLLQLYPKFYLIPADFPFCGSFLITGEQNVLIDPGMSPEIAQYIAEKYHIDIILLTHFHLDHTYSMHYFPDAEVWVHELDAEPVRNLAAYCAGLDIPSLEEDWHAKLFFPDGYRENPVHHTFTDGHVFRFGDYELQAIHTPGHTKGHTVFYEPNIKFLLAADMNLQPFGAWYGYDATCDVTDFMHSFEKLIPLEYTAIYAGHDDKKYNCGIFTDNLNGRLQRSLDILIEREAEILRLIAEQPKTAEQMQEARLIYGRHSKGSLYIYEGVMIRKHLARMVADGRLREKGGVYYAN